MRSDERRNESVRFNHGLAENGASLPVFVRTAGFSRWHGHVEVERRASGISYLEQIRVEKGAVGSTEYQIDQGAPAFVIIEQVTLGDALFCREGNEYTLGPGDLFFVGKVAMHRYRTGPSGVLHRSLGSDHEVGM